MDKQHQLPKEDPGSPLKFGAKTLVNPVTWSMPTRPGSSIHHQGGNVMWPPLDAQIFFSVFDDEPLGPAFDRDQRRHN